MLAKNKIVSCVKFQKIMLEPHRRVALRRKENKMKNRTLVYVFIFSICLFHILIPHVVFGLSAAQEVSEKYKGLPQSLQDDIQPSLPTVLKAFNKPEIQTKLLPRHITSILSNPFSLKSYDSEISPLFMGLLGSNGELRTFFASEQFYNVLKDSNEINKLLKWFEELPSLPEEGEICEIPEPEPSKATTLSIVSGFGQEGNPGGRLSRPFVVEVRDQYGEVFPGVTVSFHATKGGGTVSPKTRPTNNSGQASTILTLGNTAGTTWVEARVAGIQLTQTFTATAIVLVPPPPPPPPEALPPMYWIEGNRIYYRPTGGTKEPFFIPKNGETLTGGLAVDTVGGKVYWTEKMSDGEGRVQSANLDGTRVGPVRKITAVPLNIAVGTDKSGKRWVYWTNSLRKKIQRINVNGSDFQGNFMPFPQSPTPPNHIAFDQGKHRLYWSEMGRIRWAAANGKGKRETIVKDLGTLGGIAVANGRVYWTEQTGDGQGKVMSVRDTGSGQKLLDSLAGVPGGIAVDAVGGKVYWTTSRGYIQSAPLTGAIEAVVEGNDTRAVGLAVVSSSMDKMEPAPSAAAPSLNPAVSVENTLLANYPNPFNPETWIPYQLSASADVSVSIYSVNGHLVRHLDLGHQSAGVYLSRSRAAYWDGRNAFGERVASGLYFYTLTAGDFTATRKMLIRK